MTEPLIATRARAAIFAVPGVLFGLAACSDVPPPQPIAAPPVVAAPAAAAEPLPPPPRRKPPPPAPTLARLPPIGAPEVPAPGEIERAPPLAEGLDRLIGLDQPHTMALIGEPQQRAEAAPATIWRYIGPLCEVDVYFYLDLKSQAMRALHYEVRSHDPPERHAQRCYDELVSERRAGAEPTADTDSARR